jgi:hypothetical protein
MAQNGPMLECRKHLDSHCQLLATVEVLRDQYREGVTKFEADAYFAIHA